MPAERMRTVSIVLGSQWGDEGKGKVVDLLAAKADIVARCQGGHNAGHTVATGERVYDFHIVPSGIVHQNCVALIGNGTVIHLPSFFSELEKNSITKMKDWQRRLIISERAHIVFDFHQVIDGLREQDSAGVRIGTTGRGIGPTYANKSWRNGLRIADLIDNFDDFRQKFVRLVQLTKVQFPSLDVCVESELQKYKKYAEKLTSLGLVRNTVRYLHDALSGPTPKNVLVEGANGTLLDIDFGTYPYVTSSNCSVGGVLTGLGISPQRVSDIIGIVKAYETRVGDGPFPTELNDVIQLIITPKDKSWFLQETGKKLREIGHEYGVTTGRPRRCGWLDIFLLKYSNAVNGFTKLALTKLDVLDTFEEIKIGVNYKLNNTVIQDPPACASKFAQVEVVYEVLPGWKESIQNVTEFDHLPLNAQKYVQRIEELVGVPILWIGTGKERNSVIQRDNIP
ncbi:adenylosuccinate synthetase [Trichuris trichiura]|uniref:Adenylosuccinate synthetase n=1 Tax=Trichuris trichiura TaxID=36087 RepID=A0A077YWW7_TRITR|nr:adenylosuccinate synthetase [Trichuris trichiura]